MTHYDYEPIPLDVPERMADDALIRSTIAHRDFVFQRGNVQHFADAPIDQGCYPPGRGHTDQYNKPNAISQ